MAESAQQRSPLDQFLLYLEYERGLAANTVLSYRQELGKFFIFLERKKLHYLRLSENDILDFIRQEGRRGGAVSSQAHLISVLKSFYRYLLKDECLDFNCTTSEMRKPEAYINSSTALSLLPIAVLISGVSNR